MNHTMMDILMLGWELPPFNTGGLGVACYGLATGLVREGAGVAFGLPKPLPVNVPFRRLHDLSQDHFQVTALNSDLRPYETATSYRRHHSHMPPHYFHSLYDEALNFARKAEAWARVTPHHVIHAHDWMSYPAAMSAARKSGKPWVAHVHATEYDRCGENVDPRIAQIEYDGVSQADKVIAVSQYTKDMVSKHYSVSPDKISVVHNGIDVDEFEPLAIRQIFPQDHIVLYVGRLTYQKGVEYFLRAASEVIKRVPNTIFIVVGEGDMYEKHVLEAASLGIGHRVIFTGFLNGTKLKSIYQMADTFVMPSVSEPYGIVALEAVISGVPAIISKQSGVAETVSHVQKVDFWDTHRIAEAIEVNLLYKNLAHFHNDLARQEVKSLTWDRAARQTLAIYQEISS